MSTDRGYFNIPVPTLGGRQFWGDVLFYQGWRIQENVFTKHYRLIDSGDVRRAWGTREACEAALAEIKKSEQLPPMKGEVVIYVHGIIRSSKSISSLITSLEESNYTVVGFDYPSTQVTMVDSAAYLKQVIDSLEGVEKIHFVCHSMGGLIVRTYLQQYEPDTRIGRMVMLGVPNLGAKMADIMKDNILYQFIYGPAGQELVENPEGYIAKLPTPQFEFAVIAGARGTNDGWNPLIPGDDDGTVSVDATRLPGAVDFMTVPAIHSFMMSNEQAQAATVNFLKHGCLRESGEKSPIIRKENAVKPGE
ncbi:MAG: alpha/beta fold hydrolase [Planctomycetaceae bacterium]|nr:alpha/beta fold hydrolase [Planctomycetaceae bacterium]MCB9950608.1 alpha/beta fold hydrolase [Planctomycetaceae bacterium]